MHEIPLTIEVSYLPEWGLWEGVRELIQNAKDAETEMKAEFSVTHQLDTLYIENHGVTLPYKALLLGNTTKADKSQLIGQFGEGLKLGLLALCRAGRRVRILTGGEVWTPKIARSEAFDTDVLHIVIERGHNHNRVGVEIELTEKEWEDYRKRFLFLAEVPEEDNVETPSGNLLLGKEWAGRMYVKGIYVSSDSSLKYGYNFGTVSVDRDRKMVDTWDRRFATGYIWRDAVNRRPDKLFDAFFTMLQDDSEDVSVLDTASVIGRLTEETMDKLVAKFYDVYGTEAVPVASIEQSMRIEHLGRKGVVVSKVLKAVIEYRAGTVEQVTSALQKEALRSYSWHELDQEERFNLVFASELIARAIDYKDSLLAMTNIVDFRSEGTVGQFKDNRVLLARRILKDRDETVATLVHEIAHTNGIDGEHEHVNMLERIWKSILTYTLEENLDGIKEQATSLAG